jgi:hypothetical protein
MYDTSWHPVGSLGREYSLLLKPAPYSLLPHCTAFPSNEIENTSELPDRLRIVFWHFPYIQEHYTRLIL